jgi:hypothetical protein
LQRRTPLRDLSQPVPDPLLGGGITLRRLFRDGIKDRLVEAFRLRGQVLVVTNEACQPVGAGRKAGRKLVDGRGRGGL